MTPQEALTKCQRWHRPEISGPLAVLRAAVEENERLKAELARLKAPATDEERKKMLEAFDGFCPHEDTPEGERNIGILKKIRRLISSPPAPRPKVTMEEITSWVKDWSDPTKNFGNDFMTLPAFLVKKLRSIGVEVGGGNHES